ncbi:hypothetical protein F5883DRAFT_441619 [Diaporthe sp. PMI_573]|nr:hypothetical protein F5883DRAFT_441619 [Diaporthaceae sp. PMI_573]
MNPFDNNNQLGIKLFRRGRYEEAEQVFHEILTLLDPKEHDRLSIENNVGSIYHKKKEYAKAKDLLHSTLQKMQRQDHPHTLICKSNLAWTWAMLGDLDKAQKLFLEVLISLIKTYSPKDPLILKTQDILAYLSKTQGGISQESAARGRNRALK